MKVMTSRDMVETRSYYAMLLLLVALVATGKFVLPLARFDLRSFISDGANVIPEDLIISWSSVDATLSFNQPLPITIPFPHDTHNAGVDTYFDSLFVFVSNAHVGETLEHIRKHGALAVFTETTLFIYWPAALDYIPIELSRFLDDSGGSDDGDGVIDTDLDPSESDRRREERDALRHSWTTVVGLMRWLASLFFVDDAAPGGHPNNELTLAQQQQHTFQLTRGSVRARLLQLTDHRFVRLRLYALVAVPVALFLASIVVFACLFRALLYTCLSYAAIALFMTTTSPEYAEFWKVFQVRIRVVCVCLLLSD